MQLSEIVESQRYVWNVFTDISGDDCIYNLPISGHAETNRGPLTFLKLKASLRRLSLNTRIAIGFYLAEYLNMLSSPQLLAPCSWADGCVQVQGWDTFNKLCGTFSSRVVLCKNRFLDFLEPLGSVDVPRMRIDLLLNGGKYYCRLTGEYPADGSRSANGMTLKDLFDICTLNQFFEHCFAFSRELFLVTTNTRQNIPYRKGTIIMIKYFSNILLH